MGAYRNRRDSLRIAIYPVEQIRKRTLSYTERALVVGQTREKRSFQKLGNELPEEICGNQGNCKLHNFCNNNFGGKHLAFPSYSLKHEDNRMGMGLVHKTGYRVDTSEERNA